MNKALHAPTLLATINAYISIVVECRWNALANIMVPQSALIASNPYLGVRIDHLMASRTRIIGSGRVNSFRKRLRFLFHPFRRGFHWNDRLP